MPAETNQSVLTSIKAALGLQEEYTPFDFELTLHLNSVMATLNQLGVGPTEGVEIDKNTEWSDLFGEDHRLQSIKSYMFLRIKLLFDSNTMSQHVLSSYQKQIEEAEWRISVAADPMIPQLDPALIEGD